MKICFFSPFLERKICIYIPIYYPKIPKWEWPVEITGVDIRSLTKELKLETRNDLLILTQISSLSSQLSSAMKEKFSSMVSTSVQSLSKSLPKGIEVHVDEKKK